MTPAERRFARGRKLADDALRALMAMSRDHPYWTDAAIDAVLKVKCKFGGKRSLPSTKGTR